MSKRPFGLAVAQLGPIQPQDTRAQAVSRLVELMKEAASRGAKMVVFPELALTTFFPRYWMTEQEAIDRYFEKTMPSADTQVLFDTAKNSGLGFIWATPKSQMRASVSTLRSWSINRPSSSGATAKFICQDTATTNRTRRFSILRKSISRSGTKALMSGKQWILVSGCSCAMIDAGARLGVYWHSRMQKLSPLGTTRHPKTFTGTNRPT
jgi:hypothetical protein